MFSAAVGRVSRFANRRKATCAAFAAGAGTFVSLLIRIPAGIPLTLAAAALIAGPVLRIIRGKRMLAWALAALFLGFLGYASARDARPENRETARGDLAGTVALEPICQAGDARIVLTLRDATCNGIPVDGRVRLYLYGTTDAEAFEYGDRVTVADAKLTVPKGQTNPHGFDFDEYLWRHGVSFCASGSFSDIGEAEKSPSVTRALFRVKRFLSDKIDALYGEHAGEMRALLLGDRSQMSDETYDDFKNAGIAHLIALSGLHVTCIALLIGWALKLLPVPRWARVAITVLVLCLYARMTGSGPSVVRAVIMYALYALAGLCGYPSDLLTRLSLAFLCQLSVNPLILADAGFELSYFSVFSLACLGGLMRYLLGEKEDESGQKFISRVRQACSASASAQIGTLPLVSSLFYSVPLLSLPVNLIAVPLGLTAVFTGAASLVFAPVWMPLARAAAWPGCAVWAIIKRVTALVARFPFATVSARAWPVAIGGAYFLAVWLVSPYVRLPEKARRWGVWAFPLLCVCVLMLPKETSDGLRVTFLDVGYGDCAVIDARGDMYVVDCGRENGIAADYLTASGARVRGVFLTHPDVDHSGGAAEILRRYDYATVYVPECWDRMDVSGELDECLADRRVKYLCAGDRVALSKDAVAEVMWPPEDYCPEEDNDGCLVLRVVWENTSALFMADLTDQNDALAASDCDVVKVAHHGSKYATTKRMLDIASPDYAVISVSGNSYGHPTEDVLARLADAGAKVYRTDEGGAVTADFGPDGAVSIKTFLSP